MIYLGINDNHLLCAQWVNDDGKFLLTSVTQKPFQKSIFDSNRPLLFRINVNRLAYLTDNLTTVCFDYFAGLVVEGVEVPQDVRDIDVALRKYEGALNLQPGVIILFPEISSVEGLTALGGILDSVDRIGAMFITVSYTHLTLPTNREV